MRPAPKTGIMKASGEMEHSHDPDEYGFPETPCPKGYPGCEFFGCYGPDAVPEITATSERYQVRIWCDGDELSLPFVIHSGSRATIHASDYAPGEDLNDVAARIARSMLNDKHGIAEESAAVSIYPIDESGDCNGDAEPLELARSIQYRD